jgi:hypothetical protein
MLPRLATVSQQVGVRAAGLFQGIGQLGQAAEVPAVVDGLGEGDDVRREPSAVESGGAVGLVKEAIRVITSATDANPSASWLD